MLVDPVSLSDDSVAIGTVTLSLEEAAALEAELLAGTVTTDEDGTAYVVLPGSEPPIRFALAAEPEADQ